MLVPACRCCCRTTRRARTWKTLQKLSHHRRVYVPKYVYSLLLYFSSHYINLMCTPLSTLPPPGPSVYLSPIIYYLCSSHPPPPQTTKKILDKNDEKFLVVVMCVVNKLTHLPALPVSSHTGWCSAFLCQILKIVFVWGSQQQFYKLLTVTSMQSTFWNDSLSL